MINNKFAKLALVGSLFVATLSAASAQGFSGSHDNGPVFARSQLPAEQNKSDVGENGGA